MRLKTLEEIQVAWMLLGVVGKADNSPYFLGCVDALWWVMGRDYGEGDLSKLIEKLEGELQKALDSRRGTT